MPMIRNPFQRPKPLNPLMPQMQPPELDFTSLLQPPEMEEEPIPTPHRESYLSKLMEAPKYDDYAPSTGRRILAAVLGGLTSLGDRRGGMELTQNILGNKYNTAKARHHEELAPLKQAAEVEEQTVKEKQTSNRDRYKFLKDKNTHMMNAMKAESLHRKRMADIENLADDNKRADAAAKERERHNIAMEKLRTDYQEFQRVRERNRNMRFNSGQQQRERFHSDRMGKTDDNPIPVSEQRKIREDAIGAIRNDDRFKEYWDERSGGFKIPKGDEETAQAISEAIVKEEERIARRTRTDYSKSAMAIDPFGYFLGDDEDEDEEEEE